MAIVGHDFDGFFRLEFPAMVTLAAAIAGRRAIAEDIAQEAFTRAHRQWSRISRYDKPGAWVRRVTINLALSDRRRSDAERRATLRLATEGAHEGGTQAGDMPVGDSQIWAAVAELPGKQKAAVALHYLEDRSVAEIADILECAESTAKVHLHRGRNALATALSDRRPSSDGRSFPGSPA
jgi:RNA polymerase sigma-70 factor (ECF subfamily)